MVDTPPTQGTIQDFGFKKPPEESEFAPPTPKEQCKIDGGFWDEETQKCLFLDKKEEVKPPKAEATSPEIITDSETGKITGVTLPDGRSFLGLTKREVEGVLSEERESAAKIEGAAPLGSAQRASDVAFRGEQLQGQIGQFGQQPISPTGLKVGEAVTTGIVGAIPTALKTAAAAGGASFVTAGAVTGGIAAIPAGVIGAVAGFVGGLAASMISNFKSQRSDTTTAQQRILDEGKQTMKDWATLAKNDPVNKAFYLSEYNKQSAQIDQAYRQMKLDTSRDLAKFETALPNLAEFESFYSFGGERDTLDTEMKISLTAPAPENYDLLELGFRRPNEPES